MDFFGEQERAKQNTFWLILLFVLGMVPVIGLLYGIGIAALLETDETGAASIALWQPEILIAAAAIVIILTVGGSLAKAATLAREGGRRVTRDLDAREIDPASKDPEETVLQNVVEEMAIASGCAVPAVYVMDGRMGINAFAAGHSPENAVVTVTEGTMRALTRAELQAVIAHEFSHILNGDMLLNTRIAGAVHGLTMIEMLGRQLLSVRFHSRSALMRMGIGLGLLVCGRVGTTAGRAIKAAVSRNREFLADAAAVQFTRDAPALISVLAKIGGPYGAQLQHPRTEEASHFLFANGFKGGTALFDTHPSIAERIRRLDPSAKPRRLILAASDAAKIQASPATGRDRRWPQPVRPGTGGPEIQALTPLIAAGNHNHYESYSTRVLAAMPDTMAADIADREGAQAVVFALLCARRRDLCAEQIDLIAEASGKELAARVQMHADNLVQLAEEGRLPLLDAALPILEALDKQEQGGFMVTLRRLADLDGTVDGLEALIYRILARALGADTVDGSASAPPADQESGDHGRLLVSLMLYAAAVVPSQAAELLEYAEEKGQFPAELGPIAFLLLPREGISIAGFEAALDSYRKRPAEDRRGLLEVLHNVARGGQRQFLAKELLAEIADELDHPIPDIGPDIRALQKLIELKGMIGTGGI